MIWLALAGVLLVAFYVFALALCRSAARGDRMGVDALHTGGARLARVVPIRPERERLPRAETSE